MMLNLFLLLLFTGLVPVAILQTALYKYDLLMTKLNWSDAQNYCRVNYNDLAKFLSDSDWQRLITEATNKGLSGSAWVGIYNDINSWRWSLNELPLKNVDYTCWASRQPDNAAGKDACAIIGYYNAWWDVPCKGLRPFICYNVIMRRQTVRLQVKSDGSVFDPAVQSSILEQVKQKLKEKGMLENTTVTWRVQSDGNIFHKIKDDL
ncbi:hypothetical protein QTP70_028083 [Hemibagrus guttatus]|uniref:C-type lectin domain-containing protein n=1 Tax=Hemibagrus guttatus TaxID=175788 RepID=A0AAE0PQL6_9TELE|nr:hypothetical protein QTP70_028083 [Hemibagrus guttatus]